MASIPLTPILGRWIETSNQGGLIFLLMLKMSLSSQRTCPLRVLPMGWTLHVEGHLQLCVPVGNDTQCLFSRGGYCGALVGGVSEPREIRMPVMES